MPEKNFFDGKKTYLSAIVATGISILPDVQELLATEGDWELFNFWLPLAKIAVGASTMFFRYLATKDEPITKMPT